MNRRFTIGVLLVTLLAYAKLILPTQLDGGNWVAVSGTVFRSGTSEPLSKAQVEITSADVGSLRDYSYIVGLHNAAKARHGVFTTWTNERGVFSFPKIPAGRYKLSATRNGYSRNEYRPDGRQAQGAVLALAPGDDIKELKISLTPAATISGTVLNERKNPVTHASVQAMLLEYLPGGRRGYRLIQAVPTNDLGQYRLYWLPPGEYLVALEYGKTARHENVPTVPENRNIWLPDQDYPRFFYPNTTDVTAAKPIVISGGRDVTGIDFGLSQNRLATLTGEIVMANGAAQLKPMTIFAVPLSLLDGPFSSAQKSDPNGKFSIKNVPVGSYALRALSFDRSQELVSPAVVVNVLGKDLDNIRIPLYAPVRIRGRIQVQGTREPFNFARLLVRFSGPLGQVETFDGITNSDGSFTAEGGGWPGDFNVSILGLPSPFFLKDVVIQGNSVLSSGLRIGSDTPPEITLVVTRHAGVVSGTVVGSDLRHKPAVEVVFVPSDNLRGRHDRYLRTMTDLSGEFRIESPPPGEYMVYAFEDVRATSYYDAEFLKKYEFRGTRAAINENVDNTLTLRLIPKEDN
ncbi:MAG TPA: carboxypeptidase-like regulatory domain-containing protein [Terriglobia bacterium]|nr:carboxypeptidase-like regulatory domain-containing protein [Terriglobia bacterium]